MTTTPESSAPHPRTTTRPGRGGVSTAWRRVGAATAAAALIATLAACGDGSTAGTDAVAIGGTFEFVSPGGQQVIHYAPEDRKAIQNFAGPSLMEEGKEIQLEGFKDQVVVLNSWGQWCGPCRSEVDDLEEVQHRLDQHGGGTILGINVRDNVREKAQDFVKDNGVTYPSVYDPPFKTALALGGLPASVIPTTIVLDKQHRPAAIFLKEVTADELWKAVEPVLNEKA